MPSSGIAACVPSHLGAMPRCFSKMLVVPGYIPPARTCERLRGNTFLAALGLWVFNFSHAGSM